MKSWREGEGLREEGKVNEEKERRGQVGGVGGGALVACCLFVVASNGFLPSSNLILRSPHHSLR